MRQAFQAGNDIGYVHAIKIRRPCPVGTFDG